ncbi:hypothetical protein ACHAWF_009828, partial [Thalassiosira exigua]
TRAGRRSRLSSQPILLLGTLEERQSRRCRQPILLPGTLNTRGAKKSPVPPADSPSDAPAARSLFGSPSTIEVFRALDSPIRGGGSAEKREEASARDGPMFGRGRKRPSAVLEPPPSADHADGGGEEAGVGGTDASGESHTAALEGALEDLCDGATVDRPRKKRLSSSFDAFSASDASGTSMSVSLTKEYPFLSTSPDERATSRDDAVRERIPPTASPSDAAGTDASAESHTAALEGALGDLLEGTSGAGSPETDVGAAAEGPGTGTMMFGELVEGLRDRLGGAGATERADEDTLSLDEGGDEEAGEISFVSKHSSRKKRRQTAGAAELRDLASIVARDDGSPDASAVADEEKGPRTPGRAGVGVAPKTPKGILSSSKKRRFAGGSSRPRRNVGFGSPEAAEYNVGSPSGSMTPMHPRDARARYPVPGPDDRGFNTSVGMEEPTEELEGDLERLVANGNDTSVLLDPIDEMDGSGEMSGVSSAAQSASSAPQLRPDERTEELEDDLARLVAKGNDTSVLMDAVDELSGGEDVSSVGGDQPSFPSLGLDDRSAEADGNVLEASSAKDDETSMDLTEESGDGKLALESTSVDVEEPSFLAAEPTEDLETNMLRLVEADGADESVGAVSLPSVGGVSAAASRSMEDMSLVEPTKTVQFESAIGAKEPPGIEDTRTMQLEGTLDALLEDQSTDGADDGAPREENVPTVDELDGKLAGAQGSLTASQTDSQTMELEGTLASLFNDRGISKKVPGVEDTHTIQFEGTLGAVLGDRPVEGTGGGGDIDASFPSTLSASTPVRNGTNAAAGDASEKSHTAALEGNLGDLFEGASSARSPGEDVGVGGELGADTDDEGLSGEGDTLAELRSNAARDELREHRMDDTISELGMDTAFHELRNGAQNNEPQRTSRREPDTNGVGHETDGVVSKEKIPKDDDTVSELGMNTASHDLRTSAARTKEAVDLKLDDVLGPEGMDLDGAVESAGDVFLDALDVASANASCPLLVGPESESHLTYLCEDIESQLRGDDVDEESLFGEMARRKEELMRSLQRNLRSDATSSDLKEEVGLLLEASKETQLAEWHQWLLDFVAGCNDALSNAILPQLREDEAAIAKISSLIDQTREQVALPLLIRSARRATKKNFRRTASKVKSCEEEVSELEAQLREAERELETIERTRERINSVAKLNDEAETLRTDEEGRREAADSGYYKFFSAERLHNWVLTGYDDSRVSMVFCGLSPKIGLQLSFAISASSNVAVDAKFGRLPQAVISFLSDVRGVQQTSVHPAVSGFLKDKMNVLCQDVKSTGVSNPTELSSVVQSVELRVDRIARTAKEIDALLGRCKSSFLQRSASHGHGYEFTAHLSSASRDGGGGRLHVTLSVPDGYPFAPIDARLRSACGSFDAESVSRRLKKEIKPGFDYLTRAVDALQRMLSN